MTQNLDLDAIRANFAARLDRTWGGEQAAKALQMFDWAVDEYDDELRMMDAEWAVTNAT
jgi:hypothetical protein